MIICIKIFNFCVLKILTYSDFIDTPLIHRSGFAWMNTLLVFFKSLSSLKVALHTSQSRRDDKWRNSKCDMIITSKKSSTCTISINYIVIHNSILFFMYIFLCFSCVFSRINYSFLFKGVQVSKNQ